MDCGHVCGSLGTTEGLAEAGDDEPQRSQGAFPCQPTLSCWGTDTGRLRVGVDQQSVLPGEHNKDRRDREVQGLCKSHHCWLCPS